MPVPAAGPRRASRGGGRRRAAEDNPWAVAADAAQAARRAAVDLSRRALPVAAPPASLRPMSIEVRAEPSAPARGTGRTPARDTAVARNTARNTAAARDTAAARNTAAARDTAAARNTGRAATRPAGRRTAPGTRRATELPTARRVAGAVRDWALADERTAPVTGNHRAPGTMPLESWLLIGRHRQQALLATLIAIGVLLIAIPVQQRDSGVDTTAADRAVSAAQNGKVGKARRTTAPTGSAKAKPRPTKAAPAPAPSTGTRTTAPAPDAPTAAPPGEAQPSASTTPSGSAERSHGRVFGPANSRRRTGGDRVALTFDDGPDPVQTPKLLALLAKYRVTATFCLVGERAKTHPDLVRQIAAAGHTLCNHSWNHSLTLGKDSPEAIRKDLEATSAAIREAVPDAEIPYFRAPGGNFTDRLVSAAGDYGMTSIYWEVDPRDWEHLEDESDAAHIDRIVADVKDDLRPGAIVLSHDFNQPDTIAAYERLLPYITASFETGLP